MNKTVTKSQFKPRALEYFRQIQKTGEAVIITDHGKPVLKVVPYAEKPADALKALRGTVRKFTDPTKPTGEKWEGLK
ncbi:MAG: type II toxin-antitoxin system Phd/YefM family antitoxin [Nitrospiraceae bacterium]|nr:type II toxin-antitoxin system Phd/YefM family antitoxin [Nitrospiraceae bacterium]